MHQAIRFNDAVRPRSKRWQPTAASQHRDRRFFLLMALLSAGTIVAGFAHSYYLKSFFGTPVLLPLFHLHGAVMSLWLAYFVLQTALVASSRTAIHRRLGYLGAWLAGLMLLVGFAVTVAAARMGHFQKIPGATDTAMGSLFSLFDLAVFAGCVWAGYHWRFHREIHQRMFLFATIGPMIPAGVGRLFALQPSRAGLVILLFFAALPAYDLATRHRLHPATAWGLLLLIALGPPLRTKLGRTALWHHVYQRVLATAQPQAWPSRLPPGAVRQAASLQPQLIRIT